MNIRRNEICGTPFFRLFGMIVFLLFALSQVQAFCEDQMDRKKWIHPWNAELIDRSGNRFVRKERCDNQQDNHTLGPGIQASESNVCFLAVGRGLVEGKMRPGLFMLSWPDGNVLRATWKVHLEPGDSIPLEYAFTTLAADRCINGLRFTVTATTVSGNEHVLVDEVLEKGDKKLRKTLLKAESESIVSLTFAHDNLGREAWDVLWFYPHGCVDLGEFRTSLTGPDGLPFDPRCFGNLRDAILDLRGTYVDRYPDADVFMQHLAVIENEFSETIEMFSGDGILMDDISSNDAEENSVEAIAGRSLLRIMGEFQILQRVALLANPLLDAPILFVSRHEYRSHYHAIDTLFSSDEFNPDLGINHRELYSPGGSLNVLNAKSGKISTLWRSEDGVLRDPDISFDAKKIVCAIRNDRDDDYHIYEMQVDGNGLRRMTCAEQVADFDPIFLPDESIVFSSTREPKYNMCSRDIAANLYRMDDDGANIRKITRNNLFDHNASLTPDGRILYHRWEYVDRNFGDAHGAWTVNPDGMGQAIFWGNNTTVPDAVYNPHVLPESGQMLCIFGPHHNLEHGALALVDRRVAIDGPRAVLRTWPASFAERVRTGNDYEFDVSVAAVPIKYEDPYPLSENYWLVSRMVTAGSHKAIFLVDRFGNELMLYEDPDSQRGCFDPMPIRERTRPQMSVNLRDDACDPSTATGIFYVQDVYAGTDMQGAERGSVKSLRIVESPEKRHWSAGMWNGQGYTAPGMNWHSLENKRIIGTVPVDPDGSACFEVPAEKFVYFQLLDEDGMMIQSMRSGALLQPGEIKGCAGCHESRVSSPEMAAPSMVRHFDRIPDRPEEWYGSSREFSYMKEVQPVFDAKCTECHDYGKPAGEKLNLAADRDLVFNTSYVELWNKGHLKLVGGGPAQIQEPYSWGAHASPLMQEILHRTIPEHVDVRLSKEETDRIATWLDLNGVYYPTYACAWPESRTGRTPLTREELQRLGELSRCDLNGWMSYDWYPGVQVCFERPEHSPILRRCGDPSDSRYREAIALIRLGAERLIQRPRADMPGFVPCEKDLEREAKYEYRHREELRFREAIRRGEKAYDRLRE